MRPYDLAEFSMSEQMGVAAVPILEPLRNIEMTLVKNELTMPEGSVTGNENETGKRHGEATSCFHFVLIYVSLQLEAMHVD